jgi:two-component system response regulator AtoC
MSRPATILVADDDPVARDLLVEVLARSGYEVVAAGSGKECIDRAAAIPIDLALVDLRMPDLDGLGVLRHLATVRPEAPVIIVTAFATMDTAIAAVRAGAYDFLSKPFKMEEIEVVVRRTLEHQRLAREHLQFRQELRDRHRVENIVGQSPQMVEVYKLIARVADLDTTVLVVGETGTGKELVARAIHAASPRASRPLVVVECPALPDALFESELFGHERGAFTGAHMARRGLLESAQGGTCLLDEIGDLPLALQAKLLRVLQEHELRRVGGNEMIPIDVRVLAATNRDLKALVAESRFREDLYYRLNGITIGLPPLRERRQDLPLLAQHFVDKHARSSGRPVRHLADEALALLAEHDWPGNVRELEHVIERAVVLASTEVLLADHLPAEIRHPVEPPLRLPRNRITLEEVKRWYVTQVLQDTGGNKQKAAELLGIDRRTLYRILAREATEETTEP